MPRHGPPCSGWPATWNCCWPEVHLLELIPQLFGHGVDGLEFLDILLDEVGQVRPGARSFADLPPNARNYVARMISATLEVAFPESLFGRDLPQTRYLGVGPDPGQVIRDVPPTARLIEEFTGIPLSES